MSIQAVAWVLEHSQARGIDRLVLISLANHANQEALCWPAQRTIAREAGIAAGTVSAAVGRLCSLGELEVVSRGGARASAHYRLVQQPSAQEVSDLSAAHRVGVSAASRPRRDRTIINRKEPSASCVQCRGVGRIYSGAGFDIDCPCVNPLDSSIAALDSGEAK